MEQNKEGIVWQDRKHHLWFPWSFTKYYIENNRLMLQSGLFNSKLEETLLYRIVDITMTQTLAGKIFGTGSLIIKVRVDSDSQIVLENIGKPHEVRTMISDMVEKSRRDYQVVGKEFYEGGQYHGDSEDCPECDDHME